MATKNFCDYCQKEIIPNEKIGFLSRIKEQSVFSTQGMTSQKQLIKEEFIACEECSKKIFEFADSLIKK